jgi:predicted ArsR family transcriptional regulator
MIEEQKVYTIKQLAKKLEIHPTQLKEILAMLSQHNLVEYSVKTGKVALPKWLVNIDKKIETVKPATGEIILPKYQEVQIQDVLIGNYTGNDLELKVRLKTKVKEIAICNVA